MTTAVESNVLFGPLLGPWNVEHAILETLEEWMPSYLAEVERKSNLRPQTLGRPPTPESYKGGLDYESVRQEWLPAIIVVANPVGEPERTANAYIQEYQVEVGCVVISEEGDDPEGTARRNAGLFAAATQLLVTHGSLGGLSEECVLTGASKVEFFNPERRELAVGITSWHVYATILDPSSGPVTVKTVEPEEPYPAWPEATKDTITVVGEPTGTAI